MRLSRRISEAMHDLGARAVRAAADAKRKVSKAARRARRDLGEKVQLKIRGVRRAVRGSLKQVRTGPKEITVETATVLNRVAEQQALMTLYTGKAMTRWGNHTREAWSVGARLQLALRAGEGAVWCKRAASVIAEIGKIKTLADRQDKRSFGAAEALSCVRGFHELSSAVLKEIAAGRDGNGFSGDEISVLDLMPETPWSEFVGLETVEEARDFMKTWAASQGKGLYRSHNPMPGR